MNIQNNLQSSFKEYTDRQKNQLKEMESSAKTVANPEIRQYLEASNKVMKQLNQLDEFVLTSMSPKPAKTGFFEKIKAFFKK